jgi:asparagine synthetase B (glutamine-hydrolysing)
MCGIVGFLSRCLLLSEGALQRATHSFHHRGPDGQGYWTSEDSFAPSKERFEPSISTEGANRNGRANGNE